MLKVNIFLTVVGFILFSEIGAVSLAAAVVCVNKTELVVPIRVVFTDVGANLSANEENCQMSKVPFTPPSEKFSGWSKIAADNDSCLKLGKLVAYSDLYSISMSTSVVAGQDGDAEVSVGISDGGTPAHVIQASCFKTP
jgi:hypothetical protein